MRETPTQDPTTAAPSPVDGLEAAPTSGLLRRLASLLYDAFLVFAIWMSLGFLMQLIVGPNTNHLVDGHVETNPVLSAILFMGMISSAAIFYIWFWCRTGQTLGMIAWRIKTVSNTGELITVRQGLIRFILAWPAFFCLGLGYLWLYVDTYGDALHDKFSNTRVIVLPKSARPF